MNDFWLVLKAWLGLFGEFGGILCSDHMRFDLYHPYIEHLTDALIIVTVYLKLVNLFVEKQVMLLAALRDIESEILCCKDIPLAKISKWLYS